MMKRVPLLSGVTPAIQIQFNASRATFTGHPFDLFVFVMCAGVPPLPSLLPLALYDVEEDSWEKSQLFGDREACGIEGWSTKRPRSS